MLIPIPLNGSQLYLMTALGNYNFNIKSLQLLLYKVAILLL